jgi:hypothetical protein
MQERIEHGGKAVVCYFIHGHLAKPVQLGIWLNFTLAIPKAALEHSPEAQQSGVFTRLASGVRHYPYGAT